MTDKEKSTIKLITANLNKLPQVAQERILGLCEGLEMALGIGKEDE